MKVLVTGGTGFIGGNLVRELLRQDFQVKALVRAGSNAQSLDGLDVEVSLGDLRDRPSLERALEGCDALFHVAALYSLWVPDARVIYETNVEGTRNVLEVALSRGIRKVVYTSTVATIGFARNGNPGTETTELKQKDLVGHYKKSKYQAEKVALELCQAGLPLVVVNPTTPIGPGDQKPTPTGRIIVDFLNRRMPAYMDTGLNVIDVEDVVRGHILALERGGVGERYILGNRNLSLREILEVLAGITGMKAPRLRIPLWLALAAGHLDEFVSGKIRNRPPRIPVTGVRMARRFMYVDASKAVRELGLPQSPVEAAFEKAVSWFQERGYVRKGA